MALSGEAVMTAAAEHETPRGQSEAALWLAEAGATLTLAWPLAAAALATMAIGAIDVIMMGWLGPEKLAAGAIGHSVLFPLMTFGYGVATATAPMISQAVGARRFRDVRRTARQGLWLALAVSALLIPLLQQGEALLGALGQAPEIARLGETYLDYAAYSLPAAIGFVVLRSFAAAFGETRAVFGITLGAIAVNAALNWLLMFGNLGLPRLELAGAGIATALTHSAMVVAFLLWARRRPRLRRHRILARFWKADWPRFWALLRLGGPIGLTMLAESGLFAGAAVMMGWLGPVPLAAHAVAIQLTAISFMLPYGLSQATTVRVGLFWGAGDSAGARRAGWVSGALALVATSGAAAVFWFSPEPLIAAFLDHDAPENAAPFALAASFLAVGALFQLADGTQAIAAGALRGVSDTTRPMAIALAGYWAVGVPLGWLAGFPLGFEGVGIWAGLVAGLTATGAVLTLRFARLTRPSEAGCPAIEVDAAARRRLMSP
jgi:MATE family multidrug resistance protein